MVEWFIAPVLKTGDPQGSVGSNPTPSAILTYSANLEDVISKDSWRLTRGAGNKPPTLMVTSPQISTSTELASRNLCAQQIIVQRDWGVYDHFKRA
jgi:hypothetical protein